MSLNREGDLVIKTNKVAAPYDAEVYCWRETRTIPSQAGIWALVASFVRIEDAQRAFPAAKQFGGHTDECECVGPGGGDCRACEHGCVNCGIEPDDSDYLNDDGRCEICAQEAFEHYMAAAYDRAKDARKYGDT